MRRSLVIGPGQGETALPTNSAWIRTVLPRARALLLRAVRDVLDTLSGTRKVGKAMYAELSGSTGSAR